MNAVETFTDVRRSIRCPECGRGEFWIVPLHWGRTWGPWYCDDCGHGFLGRTDAEGNSFTEPWRMRKITTTVTLRSTRPVVLRVEGMRFVDEKVVAEAEHNERDRFFYEEHTCPTNFLGRPVLDVTDDDGTDDPHGIFAWVKTEVGVPTPQEQPQ